MQKSDKCLMSGKAIKGSSLEKYDSKFPTPNIVSANRHHTFKCITTGEEEKNVTEDMQNTTGVQLFASE